MKCEICIDPLAQIDAHKTEVIPGWIVTCCAPCDTKLQDAIDTLARAKQRLRRMLPTPPADLEGVL